MKYVPPVLLVAFAVFSMLVSTPTSVAQVETTSTPTEYSLVEKKVQFNGRVTNVHAPVEGAKVRVVGPSWNDTYITDEDGSYQTLFVYGVHNGFGEESATFTLWAEYDDWVSEAVTHTLTISPNDPPGTWYYHEEINFEIQPEHQHAYLPAFFR